MYFWKRLGPCTVKITSWINLKRPKWWLHGDPLCRQTESQTQLKTLPLSFHWRVVKIDHVRSSGKCMIPCLRVCSHWQRPRLKNGLCWIVHGGVHTDQDKQCLKESFKPILSVSLGLGLCQCERTIRYKHTINPFFVNYPMKKYLDQQVFLFFKNISILDLHLKGSEDLRM